jgi:hypothetical protein
LDEVKTPGGLERLRQGARHRDTQGGRDLPISVNPGMIAGKNESNPPDDMKLKKLRKKVQRIYADTLKLKADLKALKRQAKSKSASDIKSPPAT